MPGDATYSRADRLATLLYLCRGGCDPTEFWDELLQHEQDALGGVSDEDMHLANACLEVEAWLARRNFRRVERLLAAGMFGEEEAEARLDEAIGRDDLGSIAGELGALLDLGLLD